jgi:hypothetical protein
MIRLLFCIKCKSKFKIYLAMCRGIFGVSASRTSFAVAPVIFVEEGGPHGFISRELMKWLRVYEMFTLAMCNECATSNTAAGVVFIRVAVACRPSSSYSSSHMAAGRQLLTHHLIALVTTVEDWNNSIVCTFFRLVKALQDVILYKLALFHCCEAGQTMKG